MTTVGEMGDRTPPHDPAAQRVLNGNIRDPPPDAQNTPHPDQHGRPTPVTEPSAPTPATAPSVHLTLPLGISDDPYTRWHEHCEWEVEAAWDGGYQAALTDVAARTVELNTAWAYTGRRQHEQAVAVRIADMERHAITNWPGLEHGGVLPSADWDTDNVRTLRAAETRGVAA
jgi:hypothetical protein